MSEEDLNKTELIEILREEGHGNKSRTNGIPRLLRAVDGRDTAEECPLDMQRKTMEKHIQRNWRRIRTQLPRCTGKCTTFGCPDTIVVGCWLRFQSEII